MCLIKKAPCGAVGWQRKWKTSFSPSISLQSTTTSFLVIVDFFAPYCFAHCMCSINFVECSSIPDIMFMFSVVHGALHSIQRNIEPEFKMSLKPREVAQARASNTDEHEVLGYSEGKMRLIVVLKQGLKFEICTMGYCVLWLLTESYCNQSYINRDMLCRIGEVAVLFSSMQIRQLHNFLVLVFFFIFKTF